MSHAHKADKLLIKPAAGARPAPPCRLDSSFPRHATRPVTRRVTSGTETPGWRRPQTDRPAESHSHPSRTRAARLLGRVFASAVEDVDLGDFGQSIVEPVVDQKAAAEVPDKTTTLRFALPKRFSTLFRGSPNEMPAIESPATISRFFGCVELDGESPWLTALAAWCDEEQPT